MDDIIDKIARSIANLDSSDCLTKHVKEALRKKVPPSEILEKGIRQGLDQIGKKYEAGEYFLAELLFGASLTEDAMKLLSPSLKAQRPKPIGRIALGTVKGDIHDIGKNIFKMLAEASGFEVHDLGVDVNPEVFVRMVTEKKPDVLGLSTLLTTTLSEIDAVIAELKKVAIRDQVKILIGGNAVTKHFGKEVGADAVGLDAVEGVNICKGWAAN